MSLSKFYRLFWDDLRGREGDQKAYATFEERRRYTGLMAVIVGVPAIIGYFAWPAPFNYISFATGAAISLVKTYIFFTNKE